MSDWLSHAFSWLSSGALVVAVFPLLMKLIAALRLQFKRTNRASIRIGDVIFEIDTDDPATLEQVLAEIEKRNVRTNAVTTTTEAE